MASSKLHRNMHLFGLPYQFTPLVDPRVKDVTGDIGRKYAENIMLDAPVITIIPGEPSFLPGSKKKQTISQNILNGGSESWESLKNLITSESNGKNAYRYYDFKRAYTEYIKYVNILCRACATFLELDNYGFSVGGNPKNVKPFTQYDWRNYRWNTEEELNGTSIANYINNMRSDEDTWNILMESMSSAVDSMNNATEEEDYDDGEEGDDESGNTENTEDNSGSSSSDNDNKIEKKIDKEVKDDDGDGEGDDENGDEEGEEDEDDGEVIDVIGITRSVDRLTTIQEIENEDEKNAAIDLYITDSLMSSYGVDGVIAIDENGEQVINENGEPVMVSNKNFQYNTTSSTEENTFTDTVLEYAENLMANFNFVQFYIDPNSSDSESMTNGADDSMLKSIFDNGQSMFKELGFILNSGGIGTANNETMAKLQDFTSGAMESLSDHLSGNALTGVLGRILSLSSNVVRGDNVIFPKIYQNSEYEKTYNFTVHLKAPYGNRLGYYLDICVPLMHLLALAIPRQSSANTYSSPFLVKAYVEGVFTCNMGLVTGITISRGANDSSMTIDGLPSEIDVNISLQDLYCELMMTPQTSPLLFINNTSLIEYLAVTCGISLISPTLQLKADMIVTSITNAFSDVTTNVVSGASEAINNAVMDFFTLSTGGW